MADAGPGCRPRRPDISAVARGDESARAPNYETSMTAIYIDIETIPPQSPEIIERLSERRRAKTLEEMAAVTAPGNYKDPVKIAEFIDAKRTEIQAASIQALEDEIASLSLDGTWGQIVCVAWAISDGPIQHIEVGELSLGSEREMLDELFGQWRSQVGKSTYGTRPVVVGHNVIAFDIPYLWRRGVIHGVRPPLWLPRNPKPWAETVFDTMTQWAGDRGRISMDDLCVALGLPGKDGMTGKDVWPAVQAGKLDEVVSYCRADIERTRAIHQRMTFKESL